MYKLLPKFILIEESSECHYQQWYEGGTLNGSEVNQM